MFRIVLLWYLAISVSTCVAYWLDKRAAERRGRRTSERTLHLMSLGGGFPGAFIAMQVFRHKRKKRGFVALTWIIALLHAAGWVLLTTRGAFA